MRKPRPHDFSPDSKRAIQPEAVDVSEITPLKSKAELEQKEQTDETVRPVRDEREERTERPERSAVPRSVSAKRDIKRHAFEIYRDQLDSLKQLKMASMLTGELISMSEMVRTALDEFIQARQSDN